MIVCCVVFWFDFDIILGRAGIDPQDTLMSRQHVELLWCAGKGWQLICLSKNGCTVDKIKYNKDEVASLHDGTISTNPT